MQRQGEGLQRGVLLDDLRNRIGQGPRGAALHEAGLHGDAGKGRTRRELLLQEVDVPHLGHGQGVHQLAGRRTEEAGAAGALEGVRPAVQGADASRQVRNGGSKV